MHVQTRRDDAAANATDPGEVGLRTVRMVINGQIGASAFSAAYAAHILLGGSDFDVSFTTAALATFQFVEAVKPGAARRRSSTVTHEANGRCDDNGRMFSSQFDDYRFRPAELRDLSPYVYIMWFKVEARDEHFGMPISGPYIYAVVASYRCASVPSAPQWRECVSP